MSKPQVVVTRRIPDEAINPILREACDVRYWDDDEAIPRATLLEWVRNDGAGHRRAVLPADGADRRGAAGRGGRRIARGQHHVRRLRPRGCRRLHGARRRRWQYARRADGHDGGPGAGAAARHGAAADRGGGSRQAGRMGNLEADVAHRARLELAAPSASSAWARLARRLPGGWRASTAASSTAARARSRKMQRRSARSLSTSRRCWRRATSFPCTRRSTTRRARPSTRMPFAR